MSKLYKELKYDTDRVMQPGDPLTSFDGNTAIKVDDSGTGYVETYGEPVANSYEVTVNIPQVPGASCRIRLSDTNDSEVDIVILSIKGWSGATIPSSVPSTNAAIYVNDSYWGCLQSTPAWTGSTYPEGTVIPVATQNITVEVNEDGGDYQYCTWDNLVQVRQQTSSTAISTYGHVHNANSITSGTLPVSRGGTGVDGSSQAANKVLASPTSGTGAVSFRSLVAADIPTLSTSKISGLGDAATKNVGTASGTVAAGDHTHDAANISYDDNASYSTVAACLTDLVNTNLWVENNATNIMRGDVTLTTLTLNGKTIATAGDLNILPITTSTDLSITMTADKYMYKVTDSNATGTFPTLTAPTGLPANCYYKFELEWVTASPTATYAQTASTTPAMKWISSPVMQTDGLSHTYHISGRYDTTTSTFWMSCWKIDDAAGTITPDAHTLKYLLTTPAQVVSTTTNANDTITVQLSDHAINSVNVPVSVTNVVLKFPGQAVGKARDFMVRLVVTGSTVPNITLTEPDGSAIDFDVDDDSWTEIEQGVNLLMFTETAQ